MKRICVARFGAIGDLLMTTPVLRALHRTYPGVHVTYIVGKGLGDVVSGLPTVQEVIEFDKSADVRPDRFLPLLERLQHRRYDAYINLQRSVKTVILGWGSGARATLTYRRTDRRDVAGRRQHSVDNFLETVRPLGIDPAACDRHLDFAIPADAVESCERLLEEIGIHPESPLLLVNPGASAPSRRWTSERLAETLTALKHQFRGHALAVCGGKGDDQALSAAAIAQCGLPVFDLAGKTSLKETGALLRRAALLITGDTGPMHLAAAVGTPMVALFGPTDADRTGPMASAPDRRRGNGLPMILQDRDGLACAPCMARTCLRGDQECLRRLTPERIVEEASRVIRGVRPVPPSA